MTVGRICVREVDLAERDESVQIAARRMNARNVGTLIVVDSDSRPLGIVSDRDLAMRVIGEGRDSNTTLVGDVMSIAPDSVLEDTPIETALSRMRAGPYRRLPVTDRNGRLAGMISLDDILELLSEEFVEIGNLVRRESPASLAQT